MPWSDATTVITLPAAMPTAALVVAVLTAAGLLWRYVGRPIVCGVRFVRDRLDDIREVVEQLRDVVQYVGLLGADVEARLDRIERILQLGPYDPKHGQLPPNFSSTDALHDQIRERIRTHQAIRDLGRDTP